MMKIRAQGTFSRWLVTNTQGLPRPYIKVDIATESSRFFMEFLDTYPAAPRNEWTSATFPVQELSNFHTSPHIGARAKFSGVPKHNNHISIM